MHLGLFGIVFSFFPTSSGTPWMWLFLWQSIHFIPLWKCTSGLVLCLPVYSGKTLPPWHTPQVFPSSFFTKPCLLIKPALIPSFTGELTWQSPQEAWQLLQDWPKTFSFYMTRIAWARSIGNFLYIVDRSGPIIWYLIETFHLYSWTQKSVTNNWYSSESSEGFFVARVNTKNEI